MSKSHCSSQLDTWNAYDETGNSLFVNNSNIKIQENELMGSTPAGKPG